MTKDHSLGFWIASSLTIGVIVGVAIGWKAHSIRNQWLKDKRDFYLSKASNAQERLES
jgi:Na+/H+-dicarboxylate symporter